MSTEDMLGMVRGYIWDVAQAVASDPDRVLYNWDLLWYVFDPVGDVDVIIRQMVRERLLNEIGTKPKYAELFKLLDGTGVLRFTRHLEKSVFRRKGFDEFYPHFSTLAPIDNLRISLWIKTEPDPTYFGEDWKPDNKEEALSAISLCSELGKFVLNNLKPGSGYEERWLALFYIMTNVPSGTTEWVEGLRTVLSSGTYETDRSGYDIYMVTYNSRGYRNKWPMVSISKDGIRALSRNHSGRSRPMSAWRDREMNSLHPYDVKNFRWNYNPLVYTKEIAYQHSSCDGMCEIARMCGVKVPHRILTICDDFVRDGKRYLANGDVV